LCSHSWSGSRNGRPGVAFGLGSAICRGFTAASDDDTGFPWNGFFNACAADCAAIAVGYLAPKEACMPPPSNWLMHRVCSLYPVPLPANR
jgi:hypothetical protein